MVAAGAFLRRADHHIDRLVELNKDFQRRKDFLSFTDQDEEALRALQACLGPQAAGFVDSFYDHLLSFPETRAMIPDEETLQRLKRAQKHYFERLIAGDYDRAYLEERLRVGLVHARVGLAPGWYLGAYSHYLNELMSRMGTCGMPQSLLQAALRALVKVVFLDVGLAIDSYIAHRDELISDLRDYGAAFAKLPYGTLVATADLQVVFANQAFERLFGFAPNSLRGHPLSHVMSTQALRAMVDEAMGGGHAADAVELQPHAQPLAVPVNVTVHRLPQAVEGGEERLLLVFEDLRQQAQLTRDLYNAQAVANIGTWRSLADGRWSLTPQSMRLLGWRGEDHITFAELLTCLHPDDRERFDGEWQLALGGDDFKIECRVQGHPGTRWVEIRGRIERSDQGTMLRAYGTVFDITDRKLAERAMERLAFFDALTGLPNRTNGMMLAQQMLDRAQRKGRSAQVLFVDLDRFKEINDTQGHVLGDNVLSALAERFREACGSTDVVSRVGGDEFMCVHLLEPGEDPLQLAQRVHAALLSPVIVDGIPFEVGASIGVSISPEHGSNVEQLLKNADIAMYEVKAQGGGWRLYTASMGAQLERRIALGVSLAEALERSGLSLHYQPKIGLRSGELCGVEALSRWNDPHWGWVSPAEFIPIAEERGLIETLGDWTLTQAARDVVAWRAAAVTRVPLVAVNVSAVQMMDDTFPTRAAGIVHAQGAVPSMFELEITESALMHDPEKARRVASMLVSAGFRLSIDDFGTGFSSLARLQNFPVSKLKIDMSFVRAMVKDAGNLAIVSAVIGLAKALKLATVAEGVETEEQAQLLRDMQCDEAQGWLYAKAISAEDLERSWLR